MLIKVNHGKEVENVDSMFRLGQIIIEQNKLNDSDVVQYPKITIMNGDKEYFITFNKNLIGYDVSTYLDGTTNDTGSLFKDYMQVDIKEIGQENMNILLELSYIVRAIDGNARWDPNMETSMIDFIQTKALLTEFVHEWQNNTK